MNDSIIRVENLGKRYRLQHREERARYGSLRETIAHKLSSLIRRRRENESTSGLTEDFWALHGVSFEIGRGEFVGIVGRNGAGKSTLLKVLSRITEPTVGRITLNGRVSSLLEVGTGFHAELSGRENIYLNGSIMGMRRAEISRKFDEIVAFAEVEKFLDTPVKRYSSGMYVRLAFAVAAHLEPEILIVDEVLAVGDGEFQKKCLGKMENVAKGGVTLLLVSHNMGTIGSLCSRALYLQKGSKIMDGPTNQVVDAYLADRAVRGGEVAWGRDITTFPGNERVRMSAVRIVQEKRVTTDVDMAKEIEVQIDYEVKTRDRAVGASIHLLDRTGTCILATGNGRASTLGTDPLSEVPLKPGKYRSTCTIPADFLNEGRYLINAFLVNGAVIEAEAREVLAIDAHDSGSMRGSYQGVWIGQIRTRLKWISERCGA